jgi:DNA excision repair protein ERCC-2
VCLLAVITAYQYWASKLPTGTGPTIGKLVYCTRTVQEMDKTIEELRKVIDCRNHELAKRGLQKPPVRFPSLRFEL